MNENEPTEVYRRAETDSPDFSIPSPAGSPTGASEMSDS